MPNEIMNAYKLRNKIHNRKICMAINKDIYSLKEAGALANQQLQQHLAPCRHTPTKFTPSLWKHKSNNAIFTLIVDDFGIKYIGKDNAQYLIDTLKDKYEDVELS